MLTALLIFLLVLIALLAIPLAVEFELEWPGRSRNEIVLAWAFGFVRARVPGRDSARAATKRKQAGRRESGGSRPQNMLAALRLRDFRRRLYRFGGDLWRSIDKQDIRIHARVGLGNPADTGMLWAAVGPVSGLLASARGISVSIEPDFVAAVFEVDGRGRFSFVPLRLIAIMLGMVVSPTAWRGLRAMKAS